MNAIYITVNYTVTSWCASPTALIKCLLIGYAAFRLGEKMNIVESKSNRSRIAILITALLILTTIRQIMFRYLLLLSTVAERFSLVHVYIEPRSTNLTTWQCTPYLKSSIQLYIAHLQYRPTAFTSTTRPPSKHASSY